MRIAFFGGSFDPPHCGHLAIARAALDRVGLDRVVFAPVGTQPLKRDLVPAGYQDRLAMVRLAVADDSRLAVSEIDAPRADGLPNYTARTLDEFRYVLGDRDDLFCLLGADSFLTLRQWHRAPELLMSCDFIVAGRPGFSLDDAESALPRGVSFAGDWRRDTNCVSRQLIGDAGTLRTLYLLPDLKVDISATEIRAALGGGGLPQTVLPARVVAYIHAHGLYR